MGLAFCLHHDTKAGFPGNIRTWSARKPPAALSKDVFLPVPWSHLRRLALRTPPAADAAVMLSPIPSSALLHQGCCERVPPAGRPKAQKRRSHCPGCWKPTAGRRGPRPAPPESRRPLWLCVPRVASSLRVSCPVATSPLSIRTTAVWGGGWSTRPRERRCKDPGSKRGPLGHCRSGCSVSFSGETQLSPELSAHLL